MARKGKAGLPRQRRPQHELEEALRRIHTDMVKRAADYDAGDLDQALWLSVHLRTLLHFGHGRPLLWQLRLTEHLRLVDTAPDQSNIGNVIWGGLVSISATSSPDGSHSSIMPAFGDADHAARRPYKLWWGKDLAVQNDSGRWFTRQFVVTRMANEDGAHVDGEVTEDYGNLKVDRGNWSATIEALDVEVGSNVAFASVRQVAWEVTETLQRECAAVLSGDSAPSGS